MTGPAFRHWLTGFVFAAIAHLLLAAFLMAFWRETPPEPGSAERPGLEVTLFPGFHQAVRQVSPEAPPALARGVLPPDTALESAPSIPLLPTERTPEPVTPVTADAVATAEFPTPVAADAAPRQPPTDTESALRDAPLVEVVEAGEAPEVLDLEVPGRPVAPQILQDAVEIPAARIDLATEFPRTLEPSPASASEARVDPIVLDQPEALVGLLPSDPVLAALSTPTDTVAVVRSEVASFVELEPIATLEDAPERVVMAVPETASPTAAIPVIPDPIATIFADPTPPMAEPVLAATAHELAPLVATAVPEVAEATDVAMVDVPAEAVSVEPAFTEIAQITELQAVAAESVAAVEPVAITETVALLPETETVARESPPRSSAPEPGAPEEEEDARKQDLASSEAPPDVAQTAGVQDHYFRMLRDWLDRHKDYPRLARRRGEEGTVVLAFTLNRHGMVLEHAILRSSGHTMLDNTVEHLIRRAQPLPAFPPEMNAELLQVIVPIEFRLER